MAPSLNLLKHNDIYRCVVCAFDRGFAKNQLPTQAARWGFSDTRPALGEKWNTGKTGLTRLTTIAAAVYHHTVVCLCATRDPHNDRRPAPRSHGRELTLKYGASTGAKWDPAHKAASLGQSTTPVFSGVNLTSRHCQFLK